MDEGGVTVISGSIQMCERGIEFAGFGVEDHEREPGVSLSTLGMFENAAHRCDIPPLGREREYRNVSALAVDSNAHDEVIWRGHSIWANTYRTLNSLPREEIDRFIAALNFSAPVTIWKQTIDIGGERGIRTLKTRVSKLVMARDFWI